MTDSDRTKEQPSSGFFEQGRETLSLGVADAHPNRVEEELRDSEERFRSIYAQSPIGIAIYDSDGQWLDENQACLDIFGICDVSEIKRFNFFNYPYPLLLDETKERLRKGETIRYVGPFDFEKLKELGLFKTSKSGLIYLFMLITPLDPTSTQPLGGYLVQIQDITEQKQAEEALKQSEERFRLLLESISDSICVLDSDWRHMVVNDAMTHFVQMPKDKIIGNKLADLFPGAEKTAFLREFEEVMKTRKPGVAASKYRFASGIKGWLEVHVYPVPEGVLCIANDITERKRAEEEVLRRNRELAAVHNVLMSTTQTLNLDEVLRGIVSQVGAALDSAYTSIVMVDREGGLGGGANHFVNMTPLSIRVRPRGVTRRIVTSGEPVFVADVGAAEEANPALADAGIRSLAGMPIKTKDATIGVLFVHSVRPNAFGESMELLATFANQAAIAIENARLYETVRAEQSRVEQLLGQVLTAQEDERRRLSLDLHDTVTQSMYGVLARIHAADMLLSRNVPGQAEIELAYAREALEQTLSDLRRVAADLHPPALDKTGLVKALRQHVDQFDESNPDLACSLEVEGAPRRLPSGVEIGTYRIVQEALNNTRRHARATCVVVKVTFLPDSVAVEVADNGRGFGLSGGTDGRGLDGHLGLVGMRERAELLGGTFRVENKPGAGAKIAVSVPVSTRGRRPSDGPGKRRSESGKARGGRKREEDSRPVS